MSVTSIDKTQDAASCKVTDDEVAYDAPYRFKLSSPTQGPGTIISFLRAGGGPWSGSTFAYGDDADPAATFRHWTGFHRVPMSDAVWLGSAHYSTKQEKGESQPDTNGTPTNWPPDWRPQVDITWAQHEEPCYKARYRSGFVHDPARFTAGELYAPQNSALEIYDPPLMKDLSRATFSCRFYSEFYNLNIAGQIQDLVNKTSVAFQSYIPIIGGAGPYTLKVSDCQGRMKRDHREYQGQRVWIDYYEITIEVQYNKRGWREPVVDRGWRHIVKEGDPDGFGGTISFADLLTGKQAPNKAILGRDGIASQTPVLLDGKGLPLMPTDRTPREIVWSKYDEESFVVDDYLQKFFAIPG